MCASGKALFIGFVGWAACIGPSMSIAAPPESRIPARPSTGPQFFSASPESARRSVFLGIMGEIARPGVYKVRQGLNLAGLLQRAGGTTRNARSGVSIVRNGRVAQQVFLPGASTTPLMGGDLVIVERGRPTFATGPSDARAAMPVADEPTEVQLAFVNLLERPIVVKMSRELATVAKIVEFLGQSNELDPKVRIIAPAGSRSSTWIHPLDTGSVLVFPAQLVRGESLPSFPDVIEESREKMTSILRELPLPAAGSSRAAALGSTAPSAQAKVERSDVIAPDLAGPSLLADKAMTLFGLSSQRESSPIEPNARSTADRTDVLSPFLRDFDEESDSRPLNAGRTTVFVWMIGIIAAASMLSTIISIVRRWRHRSAKQTNALELVPFGGLPLVVPPAPLPTGVRANRRLRVDARQPMTRLSIDLAVLEKASPVRKTASESASPAHGGLGRGRG